MTKRRNKEDVEAASFSISILYLILQFSVFFFTQKEYILLLQAEVMKDL